VGLGGKIEASTHDERGAVDSHCASPLPLVSSLASLLFFLFVSFRFFVYTYFWVIGIVVCVSQKVEQGKDVGLGGKIEARAHDERGAVDSHCVPRIQSVHRLSCGGKRNKSREKKKEKTVE
jgi:hypothetical protein